MSDFLIRRDDLRDVHWAEQPAAPLADGCARLKVDAFALTANNVTYATFGVAMKYWDFFPAADPAFGRVPVWGFATVVESNAEGVEAGQRVYGYLPISDHFDVQPVKVNKASFMDGAAHRQGLAPIYNTYIFTAADPSYDAAFEAQQMLFRPLFTTGWMIDDTLMETGDPIPETVVISSASSKTAMALAHCLKQRGTVDTVGLTSEGNKAFVESTGLYGRVRTYADVDRLHARGLTAFVDFLGRPSLTADVHNALKDRLVRSLVIGVTDWEGNRAPIQLPEPQPEFFFVPTYAAERAKQLGADVLNAKLSKSLASFYRASSSFVTPETSAGQDAIARAWQETLDANVSPATGLILTP
jgi:NADPH:quinone reductase-like Zn-dependent oxidoreductase